MGGNRQIARLRAKAKSAEDLAAKLERTHGDDEMSRRVIESMRSDAQNLHGLVFFLETMQKHGGHRQ
jgi:hypothetical protein